VDIFPRDKYHFFMALRKLLFAWQAHPTRWREEGGGEGGGGGGGGGCA
jgi:hypothetical protein